MKDKEITIVEPIKKSATIYGVINMQKEDKLKMYSVLIMGGSDFVGSSLAKYLIKNKYEVDILTRGIKPINYQGIHQHLICDRVNEKTLKKSLKNKKYDYVFDISAQDKVDIDILFNNIDLTNLKKYILILSSESNMVVSEFQRIKIRKKRISMEEYMKETLIPYMIVKPSHIYGDKNKLSDEAYFFNMISNSTSIEIPKDIKIRTQFIYIDDLIKVLYSLMISPYTKEVYNVTSPQIITLEDYINTCGEVIGKEPKIKYVDIDKINLELKQHFNFGLEYDYLNIDKIIQQGIYMPNVLLCNGIMDTYKWYKKVNEQKIVIKDKLEQVFQIV